MAIKTDLTSIKEVYFPNSMEAITKEAFSDCSNLISVSIPKSVTHIGEYAFSYCSSLTQAEFASVESLCKIKFDNYLANPLYYAHNLYIDGKQVKELVIPESVTRIEENTFLGCSCLTSVSIGNSVKYIDEKAFSECPNVETLIYAEGCETALKTCLTSINQLYFPKSLKAIGEWAFSGCKNLKSITIPSTVTSIGYGAFNGCSNITQAEFCSLETLCNILFENDESNPLYYAHHLYIDGKEITKLEIPNSAESIGDYAFTGCSYLTSVTIPQSITNIGINAFEGCTNVEKLIYEEGCETTLRTYLTSIKEITLPSTLSKIGDFSFENCTYITNFTIPHTVKSIGKFAFFDCYGLKEISIPDAVTTICDCAFHN